MHDGALIYFGLFVHEHLDEIFFDKWISINGSKMAWSLHILKVKPIGFFLWDYAKSLVYSSAVDVETIR